MNSTSETKVQEETKETKPTSVFVKNYDRASVLTKLNMAKDYLMGQGVKPEWGIFELYSIYHCTKQPVLRKSKCFGAKVRIPLENYTLAEQVDHDLRTNQKELARAIDLQCHKHPGDRFEPFVRLSLPGTSSEELSLKHESGKILLVVFWATWCKNSLHVPENINSLLEKNASRWKDKVQAVCIGAERSKENDLAARLKVNPYSNFVHYETQVRWDHPSFRMYGIRASPHLLLCDQDGAIKFSGIPDKIALESTINEMIETTELAPTTLARFWSKKESIGDTEFKKIRELLKHEAGKELSEMNNNKNREGFFGLGINLKKTQVFDLGLGPAVLNLTKLTVSVSVLDSEEERVLKFVKNKLKSLPPEYYDIHVDTVKSMKFEYGKECAKCKSELSEKKPQYYSPIDQVHYCEDCGQFVDKEKVGSEKLVSPNPLMFVNATRTEDLNRLIAKGVTNAFQCHVSDESEESEFRTHPGIACDSCSNDLENTTRWKCLNCMDLDICGDCFEKLKAGDENVKTTLHKCGHDETSHSYYRFYYKALKV